MSPGPNERERDRAAVGVLAHRAGVTAADDVAGVAVVALAEDDLRRLEAARDGDLRDTARGRSAPACAKTGTRASSIAVAWPMFGVYHRAEGPALSPGPPPVGSDGVEGAVAAAPGRPPRGHRHEGDQQAQGQEHGGADQQHAGRDLQDAQRVVRRVAG